MKDAQGHGSNAGSHSAGIQSGVPQKSAFYGQFSDSAYHNMMPEANYTQQVGDLLGMWNGGDAHSYLGPAKLTASEAAAVKDGYNQRLDWRQLASSLNAKRKLQVN